MVWSCDKRWLEKNARSLLLNGCVFFPHFLSRKTHKHAHTVTCMTLYVSYHFVVKNKMPKGKELTIKTKRDIFSKKIKHFSPKPSVVWRGDVREKEAHGHQWVKKKFGSMAEVLMLFSLHGKSSPKHIIVGEVLKLLCGSLGKLRPHFSGELGHTVPISRGLKSVKMYSKLNCGI